MPPFSQLFAPFENHLELLAHPKRHEAIEIEWLAANGDVFFRPRGAQPTLLWCDLAYSGMEKKPVRPQRLGGFRKRISRCYHGRTFNRVVPMRGQNFEVAPDDWLLLRRNRALVKSRWSELPARLEFSIDCQGDLLSWASQPLEWYQNALEPMWGNGELNAARDFARLDEPSRFLEALDWKQGSMVEWEKLARALIWLAPPSGENNYFGLSHKNPQTGQMCFVCTPIQLSEAASPLLIQLGELLDTVFDPHFRAPKWRHRRKDGTAHEFYLPIHEVSPPSMHEKLEAATLWREFLQPHWSETEIATALNELLSATS